MRRCSASRRLSAFGWGAAGTGAGSGFFRHPSTAAMDSTTRTAGATWRKRTMSRSPIEVDQCEDGTAATTKRPGEQRLLPAEARRPGAEQGGSCVRELPHAPRLDVDHPELAAATSGRGENQV